MTGFLGALATFSTFALETVTYGQAGTLAISALDLAVSNIGGYTTVRSTSRTVGWPAWSQTPSPQTVNVL